MRLSMIFAFVLTTSLARAAEVQGTIRVEESKKLSVTAGYVGKGLDGSPQSNMCGMMVIPGGSGWVQCDTFKPRVTRLEFDARNGCRVRHSGVRPGRYLFYVREGEHWYDLRWVTLKSAQDVLKLDFRLSPSKSGSVEAFVSGGDRSQVVCEPVDERSRPILEGASALFWLNAEQEPKGERVIYDGLRPGAYLIRYGRARTVVHLKTGQRLRLALKG